VIFLTWSAEPDWIGTNQSKASSRANAHTTRNRMAAIVPEVGSGKSIGTDWPLTTDRLTTDR